MLNRSSKGATSAAADVALDADANGRDPLGDGVHGALPGRERTQIDPARGSDRLTRDGQHPLTCTPKAIGGQAAIEPAAAIERQEDVERAAAIAGLNRHGGGSERGLREAMHDLCELLVESAKLLPAHQVRLRLAGGA